MSRFYSDEPTVPWQPHLQAPLVQSRPPAAVDEGSLLLLLLLL
jgi:hypothetical protein